MTQGKVYLVGAGPGDPGLITLKAVECLGAAEVVIYDHLANPSLLDHARAGAELIYVGKEGSDHTLTQVEINALMTDQALAGRVVVRLKGGDPCVFGRGGEEAEELAAAAVPFEIVPGVSSAVAAPAYAGIPVTHRAHASSVGFITGHEDPAKPDTALDWNKIATGFGTLVFLMGVKNLGAITANLIQAGRDPATPAALIRWGTTPEQVTLTGTLADLAELAAAKGLKPPAVLVVGEVVRLRDRLNWFERLPLFGRRLLVTRARAQASALTRKLAALGARVLECPTLEIVPPQDWWPVDQALKGLAVFDWLVLTSPNGVDFFFDRLFHLGLDVRALAGLKLAAIGPATAGKIKGFGLILDLMPEAYVAEKLAEALIAAGAAGRRILLARAAAARDILPEELKKAGAEVHEVVLYRTEAPDGLTQEAEKALTAGEIDLVTFTSSSTVTHLAALLGPRAAGFQTRVPAACIGPITAATARQAGFRVAASARRYTLDGLVEAVVAYFTGAG
ncbi:MAG: uroporphyrinogen-III C-methyltransferase [Thermodesulfobacteriota bacterium]